MAEVTVYYEPEAALLTVFWQAPRREQVCTEVGDGILLIRDERTGEPIGLELLAYRPGDARFDAVRVELGHTAAAATPAPV